MRDYKIRGQRPPPVPAQPVEERWQVVCGDVVEVLATFADESFDAVLCDPPYGLGFMGKAWDRGIPPAEVWREVLRVLRPGAHLLAFGGTRTSHRLTCAIEDAGFEIRDSVAWLYGTGFPKSHNVSKAIDKAGGESAVEQASLLKAKREAAGLSRERLAELVGCTPSSVRDWEEGRRRASGRALEYMVPSRDYRGRLADALGYTKDERVITGLYEIGVGVGSTGTGEISEAGHRHGRATTPGAVRFEGYGTAIKPAHEPVTVARKRFGGSVAANCLEHGTGALNIEGARIGERWPANVVLDEATAAMLDEQTGHMGAKRAQISTESVYGDTGGASRFFYCAKASRKEREAGLSHREVETVDDGRSVVNDTAYQRGATLRKNIHPTVKPISLTTWLARLVLPPEIGRPRRILVPFSGSGSEMIGALLAGWDEVVGVELSEEYCGIARGRIAHWL